MAHCAILYNIIWHIVPYNISLNIQEFLCTLSISSRGTIDDKLRWAFNVYDMDNDGHVTKKEVLEIFTVRRNKYLRFLCSCYDTIRHEKSVISAL